MIILKIRIKSEDSKYEKIEFLQDNYSISKNNEDLQKLVEKAIKQSGIEAIDTVTVNAKFEW